VRKALILLALLSGIEAAGGAGQVISSFGIAPANKRSGGITVVASSMTSGQPLWLVRPSRSGC